MTVAHSRGLKKRMGDDSGQIWDNITYRNSYSDRLMGAWDTFFVHLVPAFRLERAAFGGSAVKCLLKLWMMRDGKRKSCGKESSTMGSLSTLKSAYFCLSTFPV